MSKGRWWMAAAAVALLGCNEGGKVLGELEQARVETAKVDVRAFANAYAEWTMESGRGCPESIDALLAYTNNEDARDPWGNDYVLVCGESAPAAAAAEGAGVRSNGPDGKPGTGDDVTSWQP